MAWCREEPTTQITSAAHRAASLGTSRANFRLARGPGAVPRNLRLARGPDAPSGEPLPRSRAGRPLGRTFASLEGGTPPSGQSPPRSRPLRARGPRAHSLTRALNALVRRGHPGQKWILATLALWHRLGIISRRCSANPPRAAIPGTAGELCGKVSVKSVTLCRLLPYGLHAAPFERGRRNPRKGYGLLPRARTGRHRDVGLVERVSSANSGPVRPSPPLCRHPEYCNTIPVVVGARDDKTSPSPPL
jgi:hypothetical protein